MGSPARQLFLTPSGPAKALAAARADASRGLRLVSLSEVLTALSYALDLTGGLAPGHTVRTCMIGMRIAHTLGLSDEECAALYDAVLLKDVGSSSNSAYGWAARWAPIGIGRSTIFTRPGADYNSRLLSHQITTRPFQHHQRSGRR